MLWEDALREERGVSIKEIVLKSVAVQVMNGYGVAEDVRDLREFRFS